MAEGEITIRPMADGERAKSPMVACDHGVDARRPRELRIRPMAEADYDSVIALWRATPGVGLGVGDDRQTLTAHLVRNPALSLVALRGDALVGAVMCGHDGRRGSIEHLAVVASERRRGLGRELVRRCLEGLAAAGIGKCNIVVYGDNAEGQAFWRAMGWRARDDLHLMQRTITTPGDDAPG